MAVVESENGDINISSDYCDKSSVTTHSGSIKFGSLHRKCKVQITGNGNLVAGKQIINVTYDEINLVQYFQLD
jgi:hypothetical protein